MHCRAGHERFLVCDQHVPAEGANEVLAHGDGLEFVAETAVAFDGFTVVERRAATHGLLAHADCAGITQIERLQSTGGLG